MGETYLPRILLVEDEGPLLHSLQRAVAATGKVVDSACDGRSAWQLIQQRRYDLVVTDLRMPEMDGPELLARLQEQGGSTQVMVITGYATLEAAVDCLRKGAVDFLMKPFPVEELLESVERALGQASLREALEMELDWEAVTHELALTRRQVEILVAFYRTGRSNRELAEEFCLSPHTIKSHLRIAFQRAGVTTRAQLLQKLRRYCI